MTITCRVYQDGERDERALDVDELSELLRRPDTLIWLDVELATDEDMALLGREFGFHELALEDCLHTHERPKVDEYPDYYFLVAYGVSIADRVLQEHEMGLFAGSNYLVTVRKDPSFDLSPVVKRWEAHSDLLKEGGGYLLYILLDEVVDGYFEALDVYEDRAEEVEDAALLPNVDEQVRTDLFRIKKDLLRFRRAVAPLRNALDVLQRQSVNVVTERLAPYYRDVYDHILRGTDFADNLRDILSSAFEAYLSSVSNRLNEVMKKLTSWAAIVLVPTLVAGVYGMNFVHMPELAWRYGYLYALALMAAASGTLYLMFKRRGWL